MGLVKVLITGADGFIGRHLSERCVNYDSILVSRKWTETRPNYRNIGDIGVFDQWRELLKGVNVIVHLAAKVHQMGTQDADEYDVINRQVVERMVEAAIDQGVQRFIFISSVKAGVGRQSGDFTAGKPLHGGDNLLSHDPYANSKALAENVLTEKALTSPLEVVIIRPPLVYGPGAKANFERLWHISGLSIPLPFASVNNRRDMVSVFNLCDLICVCIEHPDAKNTLLNVSDGRPYSLAELLLSMRQIRGMKSRLFHFPPVILKLLLSLLGRNDLTVRLLGDLETDITETSRLLGWSPKYSLAQTLQAMLESTSNDS
ncbi:MAG: nucleoside-diphosphate-sugar epimerase [Oceanicoccus sp.]